MLRNLEKNVIFRAIITKKILHKNKKKSLYYILRVVFVFPSAQAIVQIFGRFKMVPFPFMSHVESISQHGGSYQSGNYWTGEWTRTKWTRRWGCFSFKLSRLRPPVASDLSRKRKLVTNPGKGNRRSKSSSPNSAAAKSEPKSISAKDRAKEFKDEPFIAQANGGFFCTACCELVSLKKQNIHVHISSKKHKENKEKWLLNDKKDDDIIN